MKKISKTKLTLLALVVMVAVPLTAYGIDGQIKIGQTASTTFPIVITQPGSYVLTSDLNVATNVNCMNILAHNVTLDLNGHALIGPGSGSGGNGIYSSATNVAIKNGTVRDFMDTGIFLTSGLHEVKAIRAYNNGGHGIEASTGIITNCIAQYNTGDGINVVLSTVTNSDARVNGLDGINAGRSTLTNCTSNQNYGNGINASMSTVTNCTIFQNQSDGINSNYSTLTNCTANQNEDDGFDLNYSMATNCTAKDNVNDGIKGWWGTRIEGNNLRSNGGYGLNLTTQQNYAIKNSASLNGSGQFTAPAGNNYMPICGVDATDNCNYGW